MNEEVCPRNEWKPICKILLDIKLRYKSPNYKTENIDREEVI